MSGALRVPLYRDDPGEPADFLGIEDDLRETVADPEERAILRHVLFEVATEPGVETRSDMADRLAALSPTELGARVDAARRREGLESRADEAAHKRFVAANAALKRGRDEQGRGLQACAADGCQATPVGPAGDLIPVADRKWWCADHRHLAGPDDHRPPEPNYVIDANFALVPVGAEAERLRREGEKRKADDAKRARERREEAERVAKLRAEHRAGLQPPPGFGPRC